MSLAPRGHVDPRTGEFKFESFDLVHDQSVDPSSLSMAWAAGPGPEPSVVDRVAAIENPELAQKIAEWDERKRMMVELLSRSRDEISTFNAESVRRVTIDLKGVRALWGNSGPA